MMLRRLLTALLFALSTCSISVQSATFDSLIYYTEDYPPFNYREDGEVKGIAVDLLREVAQLSGENIPNENIILLPWSRAYRSALLKENSVLFSTIRTEHREELFKWVGPIAHTKVSVLARKDSGIVIHDPIDMSKYRIGIIRDDIGEQLLFSLGVPRESMQETTLISVLIEQLYKNRIDLLVYDERSAIWLLDRAGYDPNNFETVYFLATAEVYFAFNNKVDTEILDKFQLGIEKIKTSTNSGGVNAFQAIIDRYF